MLLGIDVGGTHTDAVVMSGRTVVGSCKVPTQHNNLLASVRSAVDILLSDISAQDIERVNLSTTLSTNALVEGRTEDVGVVVTAGPGIDPEHARIGRFYQVVDGTIDHRGVEVASLNTKAIKNIVTQYQNANLRSFAVVGKFSTRNPLHELSIGKQLEPHADVVALGHRLSGQLNFPRRIATTYYNAAVWRLYNAFADAIESVMVERAIVAPVHVLKADGGTMPLALSRLRPVESIMSGPAASVMGVMALCDIQEHKYEDSLVLDIGGTTTDIAVFAAGAPVVAPEGTDVGSYATSVRAVRTASIGIGGDSHIHVVAGAVRVGPERLGAAMAYGGSVPTLLDALNYRGYAESGSVASSATGIEIMAKQHDMHPKDLADNAISTAVQRIAEAAETLVAAINARPVYTIMELLEGRQVCPTRVYAMGAPAMVLRPLLAGALRRPVDVPAEYAIANAVGAALTRTTADLELFADTERGALVIPTLETQRSVSKRYTIQDAQRDACEALRNRLTSLGVPEEASPIDIIEASSFNMVGDMGLVGRSLRVRCQVRPGLLR